MNNEIIVKINARNSTEKHSMFVLFGVLIITAIVFSGSLKLGWTNWDDDLYVYENQLVKNGSLKEIFTTLPDTNTYNPLVMASFALEWKLVRDRPFLYHLNNYLLHLFCTALAWIFFRRIGLSIWWSGFAALCFGIHPLRVESVAWITERKDVLYALFYLAALLCYLSYLASGKSYQLGIVIICFVLSILSKASGALLPFTLVLMDFYFKRKIDFKVILEKSVFFAVFFVVLIISLIVIVPRIPYVIPTDSDFLLFERIIIGVYAYTIYIIKSIVPFSLSALYPMPHILQFQHWVGAIIGAVIFVGALFVWKKQQFITFGALFYTIHIFLFLPFVAAGHNFLNDRFSYIAYIGLFFIVAMGFQKVSKINTLYRVMSISAAVVMLIFFGISTVKYIPVWKNSETLWTHIIEKYTRQMPVAYLNRGGHFYKDKHYVKALDDFSTAIQLNPGYVHAYMNRGIIYMDSKEYEKAIDDINKALDLMCFSKENALAANAFGSRGFIYYKKEQYENALRDFNTAIELNPHNSFNYLNRAYVYIHLNNYEKAIQDLTLCYQFNSDNSEIINNRGVCHLRLGNFESALDDFNKAIRINDATPSYYINRALVYQELGRLVEAQDDRQIAARIMQKN